MKKSYSNPSSRILEVERRFVSLVEKRGAKAIWTGLERTAYRAHTLRVDIPGLRPSEMYDSLIKSFLAEGYIIKEDVSHLESENGEVGRFKASRWDDVYFVRFLNGSRDSKCKANIS